MVGTRPAAMAMGMEARRGAARGVEGETNAGGMGGGDAVAERPLYERA